MTSNILDTSADQQAIQDLCDLRNVDEEDDLIVWSQYSQSSPSIAHTSFRPKSIFYPTQSKGPYLSTFYQVVFKELTDLCKSDSSKRFTNNLSSLEYQALKSFSTNPDIIIRSSDKAGGIVLQDKTDYMAEATRLLSDKKFFSLYRSFFTATSPSSPFFYL